jgi:hypothetical protein
VTLSIALVVSIALRIAGGNSNLAQISAQPSRHCLLIVGYGLSHFYANRSHAFSASVAVAAW